MIDYGAGLTASGTILVVDPTLIAVKGNLYVGTVSDATTFTTLSWTNIVTGLTTSAISSLPASAPICELSTTGYTWIAFPKAWGTQDFFYRYGTPVKVYPVFDGFEKRVMPAATTGSVDYQVWVFKTKPTTTVQLIVSY